LKVKWAVVEKILLPCFCFVLSILFIWSQCK
jgi:hypothetical protein